MDSDDEHQLVYAALELRFSMEVIAYRQLSLYGEKIPAKLLRQWQPPEIVRTLARFDEMSDQSSEISISVNPPEAIAGAMESGQVEVLQNLQFLLVGKSQRLPWSKFAKMYHTLGRFLHVAKTEENVYPTRAKLQEVLGALEEVSRSTVIPAAANADGAQCHCGALLVVGPHERSGAGAVECPNRSCNAIYVMTPDQPGMLQLIPGVSLKCPCGASVNIHLDRMLSPETCPSCNETVRVRFAGTLIRAVPK